MTVFYVVLVVGLWSWAIVALAGAALDADGLGSVMLGLLVLLLFAAGCAVFVTMTEHATVTAARPCQDGEAAR